MNPSQKADQGRQEELEDIIELIRRGARVDEGNNVPIVLENNYTRIQAKTDLNRLITSEAERIAKLVIGEDEPFRPLAHALRSIHDDDNEVRCKLRAEQRKRLAELVKGEAENV